MSPEQIEEVTPETIRSAFNNSQYPSLIANGQLASEVVRDSHLEHPEDRSEPWCTRSQMIRYRDARGRLLVEVHQYLRPDGTLGASGRADPKRLRQGARILYVPG